MITNTAKPASSSLTNTAKVGNAETWATITTTWAGEIRTWLETVSTWDNVAKPSTSITNTPKPS